MYLDFDYVFSITHHIAEQEHLRYLAGVGLSIFDSRVYPAS